MCRGENQHHLASLHGRFGFDGTDSTNLAAYSHQKFFGEMLVNDFASAKSQHHLNFVAALKETDDLFRLDLEIVFTDLGPHLDFSKFRALTRLGFLLLFVAFVAPLTVIENLANGGICVGRDFDEVEFSLLGDTCRLSGVHSSEVLAGLVDDPHLPCSDSLINPVFKPGGFVLMTSASSTDDDLLSF